jgi:hypothetical protein
MNKAASTVRRVLAAAAVFGALLTGGCSSQPVSTPDTGGIQFEVGVGQGHDGEDQTSTSPTTVPADTVGRGPGTIGSGH